MERQFLRNKKGQMAFFIFFGILLFTLIIAFVLILTTAFLTDASTEIADVFGNLGMIDQTNATAVGDYTVDYANDLVQQLPWLIGFMFVCMLIASFGVIYMNDGNNNPIFIAFYFVLALAVIGLSILMSNAYEQIYTQNDSLASNLQSYTLVSYMILYSPAIFTVMTFVVGIFLFVRREESYA